MINYIKLLEQVEELYKLAKFNNNISIMGIYEFLRDMRQKKWKYIISDYFSNTILKPEDGILSSTTGTITFTSQVVDYSDNPTLIKSPFIPNKETNNLGFSLNHVEFFSGIPTFRHEFQTKLDYSWDEVTTMQKDQVKDMIDKSVLTAPRFFCISEETITHFK